MAEILFEPFDQGYAMTCFEASAAAWDWAMKNPKVYYAKNPKGVFTRAYGDTVLDEEFFWITEQLFITTKTP